LIDVNNAGQVLLARSWGGPLVRWSAAAGVEVTFDESTVFGNAMNDAGQITGWSAFPAGSTAFLYDDAAGMVQLDPAGLFPDSYGEVIASSGAVAGYFDGGIFVYDQQHGMQDTGIGEFSSIVGLNSRGDLLANEHNPQTYASTPKVKFAGQPLVALQELIDPDQTFIVVSSATPINDNRQFAVLGSRPTSPFEPVAYFVQARCAADFDASGVAEVTDIFAFLSDWFAGADKANVNRDAALDVADIFAFLTAWFAGC
jgi:probable HAF family extracellular repeat protein